MKPKDKPTIRTERWKSSDNKEEIHFYIKGEQEQYGCGFNPKFFSKADIKRIVKMIKVKP